MTNSAVAIPPVNLWPNTDHNNKPINIFLAPQLLPYQNATQKSTESLRKVLAKKEREEKQEWLEKALLEVQDIKKSGKTPKISQIVLKFNVGWSMLGHQANGCASKQEDGIKCYKLPPEAENTWIAFLEEASHHSFPDTKERARERAEIIMKHLYNAPDATEHWFRLLHETIKKFSITPETLFAMDKTCCCIDKSTRRFKVIGHAKSKCRLLWRMRIEKL